jgi:S1-C subfamily serine protease
VPNDALSNAPAVTAAHASVFKIYGTATRCSRSIEGSGFVFAPNRVLTNAHVVAGTSKVSIQTANGPLAARVVVYDPETDVAVLDVPGLTAPALTLAGSPAATGSDAVVLGYPEDGAFTIGPSRIRALETISGHDIYGAGNITRQIYSIRGIVRSGNSGGPLITADGVVLGIVFATALDSSDTGFVLTNAQIAPDVEKGRTATTAVGTGACT